jgi:hypothetical protein
MARSHWNGSRGRRIRARTIGLAFTILAGAIFAPGISGAASARSGGASAVESTLSAQAPNSYSAKLQWTLPVTAATIKLFRDGRLLDVIPATATSYRDRLLWQSTTYHYEVKVFDGADAVVADLTASVTTPAQIGLFPRLFSRTSFWNTKIPADAAIDPNSSAMVATSLTPYASISNMINNDVWGIPIAYADPSSKLYSVGCVKYDCDTPTSFRIPSYATANSGSDGKLVILDSAEKTELDMGRTVYDPQSDSWSADARYITESNGWGAMCAPYQRCGGILGSGLAQAGGVIRPEEIKQGVIKHALVLVIPYTRSNYIACPAVKTAGGHDDPNALPFGARVQLDPSFNIAAQPWSRWEKVVGVALQKYGAYVGDIGGSMAVRAEASIDRGYYAWSSAGVYQINPSLSNLPWSSFRVLKLQQC